MEHRRAGRPDRNHRPSAALRGFGFPLPELFGAAGEPSAAALLALIEEMTAVDHAYTPEEFERMAPHRQAMTELLSPEQLAAMSARRREAWAAMTPEQQEQLIRSRPPIPR
jgi:MerR family transcriptional regulator, thiopeptide resistance regulator